METPWHGKLTEENLNDVANKIWEMLHNKTYTFLTASKANGYIPIVYRNISLSDNALGVYRNMFIFSDSQGYWSCHIEDDVEIVLGQSQISIAFTGQNGNPLYWTIYISD